MSTALYEQRLFWDGRCGCAKVPGLYRRLTTPPMIRGLPAFEWIDFAPETFTAVICPCSGEERQMTGGEVRAAAAYLHTLVRAAEVSSVADPTIGCVTPVNHAH